MLIWQTITDAARWAATREGLALTIGTFDGVHLGHQAVIAGLRQEAGRVSLPPVVMTFRDHPAMGIGGERPPLILTLDRRLEFLASLGVEGTIVLPFDSALASYPPADFVRSYLQERLKVRVMVVGHDFRFGAGGKGDAAFLAEIGRELGMVVKTVPPVTVDGVVVSSTAIRWAVAAGDMVTAGRYLGRPFALRGEVVMGARRGRSLGFPTANLLLPAEIVQPRYGVYLVRAGWEEKIYYGVANVGVKPTFGRHRPMVEVFLFDYRGGDLYRRMMAVEFLRFLRPERRFANGEELRLQIAKDVAQAQALLAEEVAQQGWDYGG